jgi:hypothetical protein
MYNTYQDGRSLSLPVHGCYRGLNRPLSSCFSRLKLVYGGGVKRLTPLPTHLPTLFVLALRAFAIGFILGY